MKIQCICRNCKVNFLVERREFNQGGGIFCKRQCVFDYRVKENIKNYIPKVCQKEGCNNLIQYENRKNFCCSRACANSRIKTEEIKLIQSLAAKNSKKVLAANILRRGENYVLNTNCKNCGDSVNSEKRHQYCSNKCRKENRQKGKDKLKIYRTECKFKFSLNDYPDSFDFSLIEKFGWYSPSNKNNNLDGVSRDHMYSVKEGFINNVNPSIISHPANCRLITQRENSSKHSKSIITIEELEQRIENWKC